MDEKFFECKNEHFQLESNDIHHPWLYYLGHRYHLTIGDCEISDSLKNSVTSQEPLEKYSSRQLRMSFI